MTQKGLESAVEFSKHLMALAGGGIAFIATVNVAHASACERLILTFSAITFAFSLACGLATWSRAAIMFSGQNHDLHDRKFAVPGAASVIFFGLGACLLGMYVIARIWSAAADAPKKMAMIVMS